MARLRIAVVTAAVFGQILTGCANLLTIDRQTTLPTGTDPDSGGVAIHLDAKQRVAISKKFGAFCAEPSPDALSIAASSLGAGAAATGVGSGAAASSFSEGAASIGLRTQSITLMRDALYRVCELYYGRAFNGTIAAQMHRGYQDVLVALLAIEQLTGPAIARQAALTGDAASSGLATVGPNDPQLVRARQEAADAQTELNNANAEVGRRQDALDAADRELEKANTGSRDGVDDALEIRRTRQSELNEAKRERNAHRLTLETKTAEIQALEARAGAAGSSSASTSAQFSVEQSRELEAASIAKVTEAVSDIVLSLTEKDDVPEQCAAFLMDRRSTLYVLEHSQHANDVKQMCLDILKNRANAIIQASADEVYK